ncbi:thioredoxin domain-containing protein [Candidatus Woesearchaeota archaeon]|nr:thioredoxin domain-containing protein [Candidatus Woesearchaeota archaeon]
MEENKNTITLKKTTIWKALSAVLFLLLIASIYTSGFGIFTPTGGTVVEDETPNKVERIDTSSWDLSNEPMLGDSDAPVEMIIFDDFQCPFCARFEQQSFLEIKKDYIDTGKVKFIYMHFPLGFHSMAGPAALATECAHEQGKFWELHDKIFANQGALSEDNLKKWAEELGLDMDKFNSCYDSGKYIEQIQTEMALGQSAGIQGTPSFLINGKLAVGALPMEDYQGQSGMEKGFTSLIEEELN